MMADLDVLYAALCTKDGKEISGEGYKRVPIRDEVKVYIDEVEAFPIYEIVDEAYQGAIALMIPRDLAERLVAINAKHEAVQREVRTLIKKTGHGE